MTFHLAFSCTLSSFVLLHTLFFERVAFVACKLLILHPTDALVIPHNSSKQTRFSFFIQTRRAPSFVFLTSLLKNNIYIQSAALYTHAQTENESETAALKARIMAPPCFDADLADLA